MVKIIYFSEFKIITEKDEEIFDLEENTIKELINSLISKYPKLNNLLLESNTQNLNDQISIALNHNIIPKNENLMNKKLNNNDIISFLLPVAGG